MLGYIINLFARTYGQFKKLTKKNPIEAQADIFKYLLKNGKGTVFGKDHHFVQILKEKNADDIYRAYKENVPARTYTELQKYWDEIAAGKKSVVWLGIPSYFLTSSGLTSNVKKLIPITPEYSNWLRRSAIKYYTLYIQHVPASRIFDGKILFISSTSELKSIGGVETGFLSGLTKKSLPKIANYFVYPTITTSNETNFERYIHQTIKETSQKDIRLISGVAYSVKYFLEQLLSYTHKNNLREIWPNLEAIVLGGAKLDFYRPLFIKLVGDDHFNFWNLYAASEGGIIGYNLPGENSDILNLNYDDGIFFEFIKEDEFYDKNPKRYWIKDILAGQHKEDIEPSLVLVINTSQGLWSYVIGDIIQFVDNTKLSFKFIGRLGHALTKFTERLTESQVDQAFQNTNQHFNLNLKNYHGTYIEWQGKETHIFLCEFEKNPENLAEYTDYFEMELGKVNFEYEDLKHLIPKPIIYCLPENTFIHHIEASNKLNGHFKVLKLSEKNVYAINLLKESLKIKDDPMARKYLQALSDPTTPPRDSG